MTPKAPSYDEIYKKVTGKDPRWAVQPNRQMMQRVKDEYDRQYALYLLEIQKQQNGGESKIQEQSPITQQQSASARPVSEANAALIQRLRNVLPVVSAAPTYVPRNFLEQFAIYSSGGTFRLYVYTIDYDTGTGAWKYVALT